MKLKSNPFLRSLLAVSAVLTLGQAAHALQWDGNATTSGVSDAASNWNTASNWWNGTNNANWTDNSDAQFGTGTLGTAGNVTISGANPTVNSITFNTPFGGNFNITGGTVNLLNTSTDITVNGGSPKINSTIAGSGKGINKKGTGQLQLTGVISYTGATTITDGTLRVDSGANGLFTSTSGFSMDGGSLVVNAGISQAINKDFAFNSASGTITSFDASSTILYTLGGTMNITSSSAVMAIRPRNTNAGATLITFDVTGKITGAGSFKVAGNGGDLETAAVKVSNTSNDYSGTTTISGGRLVLGNSGVIPNGSTVTMSLAGSMIPSLDLNGKSETIAGLSSTAAGALIFNNSGAGTSTLTVGFNNATDSYAGVIKNDGGTTGGTVALSKTGSGTQTLSGANAYSGGTIITNGTLSVGNAAALGAGVGSAMGPNSTLTSGTTKTTISGASSAATVDLYGNTVSQSISLDGSTNGASLINSNTSTAATISGGIAGIQFTANPTNLNAGTTVSITGGTGSGATVTAQLAATNGTGANPTGGTFSKTAGGSSYAVGNVLTLSGGGGTAQIYVDSVTSGAITNWHLLSSSGFTSTGAVTVSGGAGIGATFSMADGKFTLASLTATAAGSYTVGPTSVSLSSGTGFTGAVPFLTAVSVTGANNNIGGAGDMTIASPISNGSGTGGFNKTGNGTLTLTSNSNSYSGATNVTGGKLIVNGNISTSSLTTVSGTGTTLAGNGTVGSALIQGGATLSPGLSGVGNLTAESATFDGGTHFAVQIDKPLSPAIPSANLLTLTGTSAGTLTIGSGALLDLSAVGSGSLDMRTRLTLISYLGSGATWNGGLFTYGTEVLSDGEIFSALGYQFAINYDDTMIGGSTSPFGVGDVSNGGKYVTLTVVPEPDVSTLIGGIGMLFLLRRRR